MATIMTTNGQSWRQAGNTGKYDKKQFYKYRGWSNIWPHCPTHNPFILDQDLKFQWGVAKSATPLREQSWPTLSSSSSLVKVGLRPQYHNPDPIVHLIGLANEADVLVNNVETKALVDSVAQVSTISRGFEKQLGLKIRSMKKMWQEDSQSHIWVLLKLIWRFQYWASLMRIFQCWLFPIVNTLPEIWYKLAQE